MSDFWDYRGWERHEENNDWQDIQGENLEYRADGLMGRAAASGLERADIEKTVTYLAAAADLNRQIERIPELLECLLMLGDCYLRQEKGDDVAEVAIEAEKIALQNFNDSARAKAIHLQGYNYFLKKKYSPNTRQTRPRSMKQPAHLMMRSQHLLRPDACFAGETNARNRLSLSKTLCELQSPMRTSSTSLRQSLGSP